VKQAPGQDPDGVEEGDVAGDEKEKTGNDRRVEGKAPRRGQVSLSSDGVTGTGDPHEQTRLRTAHSILRRRPQAGQPMYRPASKLLTTRPVAGGRFSVAGFFRRGHRFSSATLGSLRRARDRGQATGLTAP
jgi:hypothetical protein